MPNDTCKQGRLDHVQLRGDLAPHRVLQGDYTDAGESIQTVRLVRRSLLS